MDLRSALELELMPSLNEQSWSTCVLRRPISPSSERSVATVGPLDRKLMSLVRVRRTGMGARSIAIRLRRCGGACRVREESDVRNRPYGRGEVGTAKEFSGHKTAMRTEMIEKLSIASG